MLQRKRARKNTKHQLWLYSALSVKLGLVIFLSSLAFRGTRTSVASSPSVTPIESTAPTYNTLLSRVQTEGKIEVIVTFRVPFQRWFAMVSFDMEQRAIKVTRLLFLSSLSKYKVVVLSEADWIVPAVWLYVDETALRYLINSPCVEKIEENIPIK